MTFSRLLLLLSAAIAASGTAAAQPEPLFAGIFSDHAVLQRDRPIDIWGHAPAGEHVVVSLDGRSVAATADTNGEWHVAMPALPAGGPYQLVATAGTASQTLIDIMIGDVILCSGQSNMEFPAKFSTGALTGLAYAPDPQLRFVNIENDSASLPARDLKRPAQWRVIDENSAGDASAVCFYMARSLQRSQKVPIGFVTADWGGTTIQNWISGPALEAIPAYSDGARAVAIYGKDADAGRRAEAERNDIWWRANDPGFAATRSWSSPGFDDAAWPTISPGGGWRSAGVSELAAFEGVVWLRKKVTLTAAQAAKANRLILGPIDTFDTVWINGQWTGANSMSWFSRDYPVPQGVFKEGSNIIAIRILGSDGLTGQPQAMNLALSDGSTIPIDGKWSYRAGAPLTRLQPPVPYWQVPTSFSTLYNAMIFPISGYGYKLVAWYQGESNILEAKGYDQLLRLMMADWRKSTGQADLPFVIAQLAPIGMPASKPEETPVAHLRDIQAKVARDDPRAALAVTLDLGDRWDIHPTQKMIVGERLARAARNVAFGSAEAPGGPEVAHITRDGDDLIVAFDFAEGGLRTYSSEVAIGFEACAGRECKFVAGRVDGNRVILKGANSAKVDRVRYAWANAPYINLYSVEDLPAVPFEWPVR